MINSIGNKVDTGSCFSCNCSLEGLKQKVTKVAEFVKENCVFLAIGAYFGGWVAISAASSLPVVFAGAVAGSVIAHLFFNVVLGSCLRAPFEPNYKQRVGKCWSVEELIDKPIVEHALQRVITDLKNIKVETPGYPSASAFEIYQEMLNDIPKDKRVKNAFPDLENLENVMGFLKIGLCFGQARAQMEYIDKNYNAEAQILHQTPKNHREDVIYYQIMQHVEASLLPSPRTAFASACAHHEGFKHYPRLIAQSNCCAVEVMLKLRVPKGAQKFEKSPPVFCRSSSSDFEKAFDQTTKEFSKDLAIAGWIEVKSNENNYSHAIWFQCSDNKFRFQDTIDDQQGFFEFSSKKEFFEGLRKQVNIHSIYRQGQFALEVFGIEKSVEV